jgi:hypothetical protein
MENILDILITIQRLDDEIKDTISGIELIPAKIEDLEKEKKEAEAILLETKVKQLNSTTRPLLLKPMKNIAHSLMKLIF